MIDSDGASDALDGAAAQDFKKNLLKATNETIFSLLGQGALESLGKILKERYSVTPDEWPDHLDLIIRILESCLGPKATQTVGRAIAKAFYFRLNIEFTINSDMSLIDYVERAKLKKRQDTDLRSDEEQ